MVPGMKLEELGEVMDGRPGLQSNKSIFKLG